MNDEVRAQAQAEAEKTYKGFLTFSKYISFGAVAFLLIVASCNFGVDGTGGGYDPSQDLKDEYRSNMGLD